MDVIHIAQYSICWPLVRTARYRSQNENFKMRTCFWPWLALSLADAMQSLYSSFKDRSTLFQNKAKNCY